MNAEDKVKAVHRYVEAFEKGDLDIIRELYAEDGVVEDPVGSSPHQGLKAILEFYGPALASGAKLELTGKPRCAGAAVAFPFKVAMPGFAVEVIDVFEFNDAGKVASMKAYWGPENQL